MALIWFSVILIEPRNLTQKTVFVRWALLFTQLNLFFRLADLITVGWMEGVHSNLAFLLLLHLFSPINWHCGILRLERWKRESVIKISVGNFSLPFAVVVFLVGVFAITTTTTTVTIFISISLSPSHSPFYANWPVWPWHIIIIIFLPSNANRNWGNLKPSHCWFVCLIQSENGERENAHSHYRPVIICVWSE